MLSAGPVPADAAQVFRVTEGVVGRVAALFGPIGAGQVSRVADRE